MSTNSEELLEDEPMTALLDEEEVMTADEVNEDNYGTSDPAHDGGGDVSALSMPVPLEDQDLESDPSP